MYYHTAISRNMNIISINMRLNSKVTRIRLIFNQSRVLIFISQKNENKMNSNTLFER
jgi:hypothetical protein